VTPIRRCGGDAIAARISWAALDRDDVAVCCIDSALK
jgi:hypothetical protein